LLSITSLYSLLKEGKNRSSLEGGQRRVKKNDGSLLIISSHLPLIPPQGGKKFAPPLREDKGG